MEPEFTGVKHDSLRPELLWLDWFCSELVPVTDEVGPAAADLLPSRLNFYPSSRAGCFKATAAPEREPAAAVPLLVLAPRPGPMVKQVMSQDNMDNMDFSVSSVLLQDVSPVFIMKNYESETLPVSQ
ncbi:unnamed protein product [Pleuronectes platessa]|uniref:Uncharacterized protein n=1 Tax=Pleuronectes platessa TaxID=8262 RepID=A0A9N7U982_PLEPL|nr:unnamed protein product [Pleuronectes platessa]